MEGAVTKRRHAERKAMIDRTHPLLITRQAQVVHISRGSVYYEAQPFNEADLKLMRRIDELHMELPFDSLMERRASSLRRKTSLILRMLILGAGTLVSGKKPGRLPAWGG